MEQNGIYKKDFHSWCKIKGNLNSKIISPPFFKSREVWWLAVGVNIGSEEDGKGIMFVRPVLVLRKFNSHLFLGVPFSSKIKISDYYIKISLNSTSQSALISQIRSFSSKRMQEKLGELDRKDFQKIQEKLVELCIYFPPTSRRDRG